MGKQADITGKFQNELKTFLMKLCKVKIFFYLNLL